MNGDCCGIFFPTFFFFGSIWICSWHCCYLELSKIIGWHMDAVMPTKLHIFCCRCHTIAAVAAYVDVLYVNVCMRMFVCMTFQNTLRFFFFFLTIIVIKWFLCALHSSRLFYVELNCFRSWYHRTKFYFFSIWNLIRCV